MNPLVRETENAPIAVPLLPIVEGMNAAEITEIPATIFCVTDSEPDQPHRLRLLDKRRRRRMRLSNRS